MTYFYTFLRQDRSFKLLLIEILILLGMARLSVLLFPFKRIANWMGKSNYETTTAMDEGLHAGLVRLSSGIEAVSKYTFWKSNCFAQVLCAHWILKRKNIPHTIYFGLLKEDTIQMKAHAWLRAGNKIVTGRKGHKDYTVVGKFGFDGC
ncbi:MAG: hypothetical protein ACI9Z3_000894 [Roseivirga sp.]